MKKDENTRLKLGAFILMALALFLGALYYLGARKNLFSSTLEINSVFTDVRGLQEGNNVRFTGINVGTVKNIEIISATSVRVEMSIEKKSAPFIKKNAVAGIGTSGLMGSKIVIITSEEGDFGMIEEDDTIVSKAPVEIDDVLVMINEASENILSITSNFADISASINKGEGVIGQLISDEAMAGDISILLNDLRKTGQNASAITEDLMVVSKSLSNGKSLAGKLFSDEEIATQIVGIIDSLTITMNNASSISADLAEISNMINKGDGTISLLLKDEEMATDIRQMVDSLRIITSNTASITGSIDRVTRSIDSGKGSIGKLINDPVMAEDLHQLLNNLKEAADALNNTLESVNKSWLLNGPFKRKNKNKDKGE